MTKEKYVERLH